MLPERDVPPLYKEINSYHRVTHTADTAGTRVVRIHLRVARMALWVLTLRGEVARREYGETRRTETESTPTATHAAGSERLDPLFSSVAPKLLSDHKKKTAHGSIVDISRGLRERW
jgi:hypothetical protein